MIQFRFSPQGKNRDKLKVTLQYAGYRKSRKYDEEVFMKYRGFLKISDAIRNRI
jgi:hypothetical protein